MLVEMTGRIKKPHWCDTDMAIGMKPGAVSVSQADMVCRDCGWKWRQCEVAQGYAAIESECPKCGGKCERGSMVQHTWAPPDVLIVWSELPQ